jgi:hypothetical protein
MLGFIRLSDWHSACCLLNSAIIFFEPKTFLQTKQKHEKKFLADVFDFGYPARGEGDF